MRILETNWLIILVIASISSGLNFCSCLYNSSCFSCICRLAIFFLILLFIDFYFLSWISIPKNVQISSMANSEILAPFSNSCFFADFRKSPHGNKGVAFIQCVFTHAPSPQSTNQGSCVLSSGLPDRFSFETVTYT